MNKIYYCPISPVQRQFGLYVTGAGQEVTKPGEPYPHGRALPEWEYQLLYIRDGRGTIQFKRGKSIAIGGGCAIILHPGEWHRYRPDPKTGWSEAYIGIGGEYLRHIVSEPFFPQFPTIIRIAPNGRFDHDLLALVGEIQSSSAERPYTLALKTATLMASLCESNVVRTGKTSHNVTIRKANLHIAHHVGETIDFAGLAKRLGMGYTLFRRCFRQYNGMAPLEYQIALRIRRATHLLSSSSVPVSQIARETGFRSQAYFSKFFHEHTGMSPTETRGRVRRHTTAHLASGM